jgi:hypothetical protein
MGEGLGFGRIRWPDPVLGKTQPVGSPALPRPRRWDPHEIDPQAMRPDEPLREIAEPFHVARPLDQRLAQPPRRRCQLRLPHPGGPPERPLPLLPASRPHA